MRWIKENAKAFGDPEDITIAGESAGGGSVVMHMVMPGSAGLFHQAIAESAATWYFPNVEQAALVGTDLVHAVNCTSAPDVASCMRLVPATTLVNALPINPQVVIGGGFQWGPVVENIQILDQPLRLIQRGSFHSVDAFLVGTNHDEGTLFAYGYLAGKPPLNQSSFLDILTATFGMKLGGQVAAAYANHTSSNEQPLNSTLCMIIADYMFHCPARYIAKTVSQRTNDTFLYVYQHAYLFYPYNYTILGAFHGDEQYLLFNMPGNAASPFTPAEDRLASAMMTYWTNLAKHGNPNTNNSHGGGSWSPVWPNYTERLDSYLSLDLYINTSQGWRSKICDEFWQPVILTIL